MLSVEGVACSYGKIQALWDVSLRVDEGELVALLGSNGAGKTTTLSAIVGLLPVSQGSIKFGGTDVSNASTAQRVALGLVYVPEGRKLFPRMTVVENLKMGAFRARKAVRGREKHVFDLFPILRERRHQAAGTLSGGEQQMLAIARGIMANPKLLMLDEPSSGLAPIMVEKVFDSLSKLNESGVTILLAEQNFVTVMKRAKKAYLMESGRIIREGETASLLNDETVRRAYLGV